MTTHDPILSPWTGPHGGFPRFDQISVKLIKPALLQGMELDRAELQAIAHDKAPPTFANTIAAFDAAGRPFDRAAASSPSSAPP